MVYATILGERELDEFLWQEEIFWEQHLRVQHGDSGTSFFMKKHHIGGE